MEDFVKRNVIILTPLLVWALYGLLSREGRERLRRSPLGLRIAIIAAAAMAVSAHVALLVCWATGRLAALSR